MEFYQDLGKRDMRNISTWLNSDCLNTGSCINDVGRNCQYSPVYVSKYLQLRFHC